MIITENMSEFENDMLYENHRAKGEGLYTSGKVLKVPKLMAIKEFLTHCRACGGDYAAMLGTGVKELAQTGEPGFQEAWDALPEIYTIVDVMRVTANLVNWKYGVSRDSLDNVKGE